MGGASSKIEEDKALLLCRERRRLVRQALDGRCALADAHVSYVEALKNTGFALGKFFEPDIPARRSYTSTSMVPEPLMITDRSVSQLLVSTRSLSQHVEILEAYSPIPSPVDSSQVTANHMKSGINNSTTIQEKPPVSVTATVHSTDISPKGSPHRYGTTEIPPWDYFGIFHPLDSQFSYDDDKLMSLDLGNIDDMKQIKGAEGTLKLEAYNISQVREAEGIPELEDEVDKSSASEKSEVADSEDDFDQPNTEPLVRIFKNRTETMDFDSMDGSPEALPSNNNPMDNNESDVNARPISGVDEKHATGNSKRVGAMATATVHKSPMNGEGKEVKGIRLETKGSVKDFLSCIKEIESLFIEASNSGKQVPRMLEANKVNFRPLFPEGKGHKQNGTRFSMAFLCCGEEAHSSEEPATTGIRYLTWNRSVSSLSSSSQNLFVTTPQDSEGLINNSCMNSGSHASTLDRLYAWEKKLYDEVKASGIVRKEYDIKCKLLRQQESRCENSNKTDRTRAKVKDSYSRVRVAIHRINSISKTIEEIRDNELQPQLEELIGGLSRMWVAMLECHQRQVKIISMACMYNGVAKIPIHSESHCQAAIQLERELNLLCSSFTTWISAQRSYLRAINDWLLKCVSMLPTMKRRISSKKMGTEFCPLKLGGPPIYVTCRDWLKGLDELPSKEILDAIKSLAEQIARFMPQQEKKRGSTNTVRSLSRRFSGHNELSVETLKQGDRINWNSGIDVLQPHLKVFLDGMQTFSEKSVDMFTILGESVCNARAQYENAD